jgi:hypothetical protein
MRGLVVWESLYGNTAAIGGVVAAALRSNGVDVTAGPISEIAPAEAVGVDLLVVGGPTHAHGMSWARTRLVGVEDAKNRFAHPTAEPGLRAWLSDLPEGGGVPAAAFDTRIHKTVAATGSAARGIARRLEKRGYALCAEAESFFVTDKNRLEDGQVEHASRWGDALARGRLSTRRRTGVHRS